MEQEKPVQGTLALVRGVDSAAEGHHRGLIKRRTVAQVRNNAELEKLKTRIRETLTRDAPGQDESIKQRFRAFVDELVLFENKNNAQIEQLQILIDARDYIGHLEGLLAMVGEDIADK